MKSSKNINSKEYSHLQQKQSNKKRHYNNRMKLLAPHLATLPSTYHQNSQTSNPITARQKNNLSSQCSRNRRKMYMQMLEEQNIELERQLEETNLAIDSIRTQIFNALMHTDEVDTQNAQIQSHVLKKLRGLLQEQKSVKRDSEINICLDSCIYRIGASGSERKAILDILYSGMVNRTLPNIYRYILWSAANHTHLLQPPDTKKTHEVWWNQIKNVGDQVVQQHQEFLTEKGEPLSHKAKEILLCSRQILKQKQEIQRYGASYDNILKQMRKIMSPAQFAELFIFAEWSVHKKELELFQSNQDEEKIEEQEQTLQKYPNKKLKSNEQ